MLSLYIFHGVRIISGELCKRYGQEEFGDFLKENLKKEEFLNDFINLTDFNADEINVIMSFDKNSGGVKYTPSMISVLDISQIKRSLKKVLGSLFNLDVIFFNDDIPDHSLDLKEKWKGCAEKGNSEAKLVDMINL
jgi:hypothetical protein